MDLQAICWLVFFGIVFAVLTFAAGAVYGGATARKTMAAELVAMYSYAGAEGSKARKEVGEAIELITTEFAALRAKTSVVWAWVHKTVKEIKTKI